MTDYKFSVFRFEDIEVREREFLLVKGENALQVEPKAFRVFLILLRNPRRLVTKDEFLNAVWDDCAVTDNSLTRSIATLRRLLGDDSREPRFIATIPTIGYRFLCDVVAAEEDVNGFATEETNLRVRSRPIIARRKRINSSHNLTPAIRNHLVCPSRDSAYWRSESSQPGS